MNNNSISSLIVEPNKPVNNYLVFDINKEKNTISVKCYRCDFLKLLKSLPSDYKLWFNKSIIIENENYGVFYDSLYWLISSIFTFSAIYDSKITSENKQLLLNFRKEVELENSNNKIFAQIEPILIDLVKTNTLNVGFFGNFAKKSTEIYQKIIKDITKRIN